MGDVYLVLRSRPGVCLPSRYALQHGYALTPVYTFGESRTYYALSGRLTDGYLLRARLWTNRFALPAVAFWGEPLLPFVPRRDSSCLSFVGPPLLLPTIAQPSQKQVWNHTAPAHLFRTAGEPTLQRRSALSPAASRWTRGTRATSTR